MSVLPEDYIEKVVNDIEKYNGVRKVIKAGLIERCAVRYCNPEHLHPNPADEFSQPKIGPNYQIVSGYVEQALYNIKNQRPVYEEPVIVQKMEPDGYLLLNGHHRWFAALRMRVEKIHIKIVNLINSEEVNKMIDESDNCKLVSFDFDEVLLATIESNQAPMADNLFCRKIKERIRMGAPEVIRAFAAGGYDVCVYSSNYFTKDDFDDFFSMYDLKVNIVINGVNEKRNNTGAKAKEIQELIRQRYKKIVHVDNVSVICTLSGTGKYDIFDIENADTAWAAGILKVLRDNNI